MNILTSLSIRNLRLNKKRTISTIIGIILSVALICAVASMGMSFQATLVENAQNQSGYWHLKLENVSDEEIKKVQNALPKKEYFVKNEIGSALVRFELGKEAIYYVGSNHVSDVEKIKEICRETNNINEINQKWLDYKEKEV